MLGTSITVPSRCGLLTVSFTLDSIVCSKRYQASCPSMLEQQHILSKQTMTLLAEFALLFVLKAPSPSGCLCDLSGQFHNVNLVLKHIFGKSNRIEKLSTKMWWFLPTKGLVQLWTTRYPSPWSGFLCKH